MEFVAIAVVAALASALTMYSGFGLGTLLLPAFSALLPVPIAIAATAAVHAANNVLKGALLARHADRTTLLRFGLPAVGAALAGAALLASLASMPVVATYAVAGHVATVTPVKLAVALLMAAFAILELHPKFEHLAFGRQWLPLGGVLSGFFGGFSGHQGALRSAFLAKSGLSAQAFVGTNAVIGLAVDMTRLAVYAVGWQFAAANPFADRQVQLLVGTGIAAAFTGALVGKRYLHKVTMRLVQRLTGVLLLAMAGLVGAGVL